VKRVGGKPPEAWGGLRPRLRDVQLAVERLGTPENRCRWLLSDFVARDPDSLSTAERALWRDNLMALIFGVGWFPGEWSMTMDVNDPPDEALPALRQRVVALTRAHREAVLLPPLEGRLVRDLLSRSTAPAVQTPYVRMAREYSAVDFEAALLHVVADLLIRCERLRACPECGLLFVARRRQERHPTCARKARDARRPSRQPKNARREGS
jgi:hypothetical protein